MMKLVFTKSKWPQSLGLGGADWEGEEGQGKDRKCFLLWGGSGRQPSTANRSFARFTAPPSTQPLCPHIPFWANPERDPMKRFRNLTSIFRHLSCCKELYSPQDLPLEICMFACKHSSHIKVRSASPVHWGQHVVTRTNRYYGQENHMHKNP